MQRFYRMRTMAVCCAFLIFLVITAGIFTGKAIENKHEIMHKAIVGEEDKSSDSYNSDLLDSEDTVIDSQSFVCADKLATDNKDLGDLTILMYHNVLAKNRKQSVYCINQDSLRNDFEYLKKNGYNVISCRTLMECAESKKPLPDKAVMITFDDGYLYNMTNALPIIEQYGYTALFSVVGSYTLLNSDNPKVGGDFVYMDWDEIAKVSRNKHIEIGLHSYDLHELKPRLGVAQLKRESDEEYIEMFSKDTDKLIKALDREGVKDGYQKIYAYPFGKYNKLSEKVLKEKGIKITLTCNEGINHIQAGKPLYLLKRINRDATKPSLKAVLDKYM